MTTVFQVETSGTRLHREARNVSVETVVTARGRAGGWSDPPLSFAKCVGSDNTFLLARLGKSAPYPPYCVAHLLVVHYSRPDVAFRNILVRLWRVLSLVNDAAKSASWIQGASQARIDKGLTASPHCSPCLTKRQPITSNNSPAAQPR